MCNGQGTCRDTQSLALSILRLIEEESHKENAGDVFAIASVEVATFILNEKRAALAAIEERTQTRITIIPEKTYMPQEYQVNRCIQTPTSKESNIHSLEVLRELDKDNRQKAENILENPLLQKVVQNVGISNANTDTPAINSDIISSTMTAPKITAQKKDAKNSRSKVQDEPGSIIGSIKSFFGSLFGVQKKEEETTSKKNGKGSQKRGSKQRSETQNKRGQRTSGKQNSRASQAKQDKAERTEKTERNEKTEKQSRQESNEAPQRQPKQPRQRKGRNAASEDAPAKEPRSRRQPKESAAKEERPEQRSTAETSAPKPRRISTPPKPKASESKIKEVKPYKVPKREYTEEKMDQGNDFSVDFSNIPSGRSTSEELNIEYSIKVGGLRDAELNGIEGISEPTVEPVDYTNVPSGRDFDKGNAVETSPRAGGLNGKTSSAATKIIDTQRETDPFIEN